MIKTYTLSELADELDQAVVAQWHVTAGQAVKTDDDLIEVITDKAAITLAVPCDGNIISCNKAIGDKIVGQDSLITIKRDSLCLQ